MISKAMARILSYRESNRTVFRKHLFIKLLLFSLFATGNELGFCQNTSEIEPSSVVVESVDPLVMRGNATIAVIWGKTIKPPFRDYRSAVINLTKMMNDVTGIATTSISQLPITSPNLSSIPFAIITSEEEFVLSVDEQVNLKRFLDSGGFLFCDNALGTSRESPVETSFLKMIAAMYGSNAKTGAVPIEHPVYHTLFEFSEGPPVIRTGALVNSGPLTGVWIDDRLVAIFSNMGMTIAWSGASQNILQLKMGVNMIIFALTQRQGIAVR